MDLTRKSYVIKQNEVEHREKELREYTNNLNRLAQEKLYLTEQQKNLNQDSPFAEEYRNDSMTLKQRQSAVQQVKLDLEKIESQINSTRTQLEIIKHELEVKKTDETDFMKENNRLNKLIELKKNSLFGNKNVFTKSESSSSIVSNSINSNQNHLAFKSSQSTNNIRSVTPKGKSLFLMVYFH